MSKKTTVSLYDNGQLVGFYPDAEDIHYPYGQVKVTSFKVKETVVSTKGTEHDRVITRTIITTLPAIIEEVVEHSGLFSV